MHPDALLGLLALSVVVVNYLVVFGGMLFAPAHRAYPVLRMSAIVRNSPARALSL